MYRLVLKVTFYSLIIIAFIGCNDTSLCYNSSDCLKQTNTILEITKKGDLQALQKYLLKIGYLKDLKSNDIFSEHEKKELQYGSHALEKFGIPSGNNLKLVIDTLTRVYHPDSKPYYEINIKISYYFPDKDSSGGFFNFLYMYDYSKGNYNLKVYQFYSNNPIGDEPKMPPPPIK